MINIRITKDGIRIYTRLGSTVAKFNFYHTFVKTMGMTNTVEHLKRYVLFMDIDNKTYDEVCNLLKKLNKFVKKIDKAYDYQPAGIGTCVVLQTRKDGKHWHIIDPSIYTLAEVINILYMMDTEDIKYLACGLRQCGPNKGGWTLRIDKKDERDHDIKFHSFVNVNDYQEDDVIRNVSGAHIKFLKAVHKIEYPIEKGIKILPTQLEIDKYYTTNVVKK